MTDSKPDLTKVNAEIAAGAKPKAHVETHETNAALVEAKKQAEIKKGVDLKKTHGPSEVNTSVVVAKTQAEIKKGIELNKTDPPKDGLSDSAKANFLEDQKEKKK